MLGVLHLALGKLYENTMQPSPIGIASLPIVLGKCTAHVFSIYSHGIQWAHKASASRKQIIKTCQACQQDGFENDFALLVAKRQGGALAPRTTQKLFDGIPFAFPILVGETGALVLLAEHG